MKAAIYSRKSIFTRKGESIENQIELCKEYGERLGITEYIVYEDEGFSGGNTNRPQFQQLLKDVKSKEFDVLICYRLDRISRNVADFSTTLQLLQNNNIDFVSIKEQFDTTTPMGRAMIYISSVFAQLERETIAERVRDNMLQLAKTGRWLGGQTPLGFESEQITFYDNEMKERSMYKLSPVQQELEVVKLVYETFLKYKTLNKTFKELYANNVKSKLGGEWNASKVESVLRNSLYVKSNEDVLAYLRDTGMTVAGEANGNGILTYNKTKNMTVQRDISEWIAAVSKHKGIISAKTWLEVQDILDNRKKGPARVGTSQTALLTRILKCGKCGGSMFVKHGHKTNDGYKNCYYVCTTKDTSRGKRCNCTNIKVEDLERVVIQQLKTLSKETLIKELKETKKEVAASIITTSRLDELKALLLTKEQSIQNLVAQLAENSDKNFSKFIIAEIEKRNKELEELNNEIDKLQTKNNESLETEINLDLVIQSLEHFCSVIDATEELNLRRTLVESIVDNVIWHSDTGRVEINLWGAKKK